MNLDVMAMPQDGVGMIRLGVVWAALVLVILAGIIDIRRFVIPNWANLALLAFGFLYAILSPGFSWFEHLGAAAVVFLVGIALFTGRVFGGGDVKLMTVVAFWSGLEDLIEVAFLIALAGGVLSLIYLIRAFWLKKKGKVESILKSPVPYGVAIALGGVYVFVRIAGQLV